MLDFKLSKRDFFWIIPLVAILAYLHSPGIHLGDEFIYARNSVDLANGTFTNTGHHFDNRFGLLIPIACFVKMFGTHYFVFYLWCIFAFIGLLLSIQYFLKKENPHLAFWVVIFLLLSTSFSRLAGDLSVDLIMTVFLTIAFLASWHYRKSGNQAILFGLITSFCLFYSIFTKMTAVFCFPFFAVVFFYDVFKKQHLKFWITIILTSLLFYGIYFYAYYELTGDVFFRFTGLEASHGSGGEQVVPWNYRNKPISAIIGRITLHPIAFFIYAPGFGILMILSLLYFLLEYPLQQKGFKRYTSIYFLMTTFIFWFGSSSFQQYNPVVLVERMLLPILPAACILASYFMISTKRYSLNNRSILAIRIISFFLVLGSLVVFYLRPEKGLGLSYSIFAIGIINYKISGDFIFSKQEKLLFLIPFIIHNLYRIFFFIPSASFYTERNFLQSLKNSDKQNLVITDNRTVNTQTVFFDFKPAENVKLVDWSKEINEKRGDYDAVYFMDDSDIRTTLKGNGLMYEIPNELKEEAKKLIIENGTFRVYQLRF